MATKVTVDLDIKAALKNVMTNAMANDIGNTLMRQTRFFTLRGISPVKGFGRFPKYKDEDNYPGDLKPSRPVNLSLSGAMLAALGFRRVGKKLQFGILPNVDNEIKIRATTHNDGAPEINVAQRKFIPTEKNEEYNVSIQRALNQVIAKHVGIAISKSSK